MAARAARVLTPISRSPQACPATATLDGVRTKEEHLQHADRAAAARGDRHGGRPPPPSGLALLCDLHALRLVQGLQRRARRAASRAAEDRRPRRPALSPRPPRRLALPGLRPGEV